MVRRPSVRQPAPGDAGTSPVIGVVLVFAIAIVMTVSTLNWGLPAIEETVAKVELRTMLGEFQRLDGDLRELGLGTAGMTAKAWQPGLERGRLNHEPGALSWAFVVNHQVAEAVDPTIPVNDKARDNEYFNFSLNGFQDDDNNLTVRNVGASLTDVHVQGWKVTGANTVPVDVDRCDVNPHAPLGPAPGFPWDNDLGAEHTLSFCMKERGTGNPVNQKTGVLLRLDIWRGAPGLPASKLAGQVFATKLGAMHYALNTSSQTHDLYEISGGIVSRSGGKGLFVTDPPVPAPRCSESPDPAQAPICRFFGRTIDLQPATGVDPVSVGGGGGRFEVILTLYGTSSLALLECTPDDLNTCGKSVKMYAEGNLATEWRNHFTKDGSGYRFEQATDTLWGPDLQDVEYLYEWEARGLAVSLVHSAITVRG